MVSYGCIRPASCSARLCVCSNRLSSALMLSPGLRLKLFHSCTAFILVSSSSGPKRACKWCIKYVTALACSITTLPCWSNFGIGPPFAMNSGPNSSAKSLAAPVRLKMSVAQCLSCGTFVAMIHIKASLEYFLNVYRCSISGPHRGGWLLLMSCPPCGAPGYMLHSSPITVATCTNVISVKKMFHLWCVDSVLVVVDFMRS